MGVDYFEHCWFINDVVRLFGDHFMEYLVPFGYCYRVVVADFFVGGVGDVDGVLECEIGKSFGCCEYVGYRVFHVIIVVAVKLVVDNRWFEGFEVFGVLGVGWYHVSVVEIGYVIGSVVFLVDHVRFLYIVWVVVFDLFNCEFEFCEHFLVIVVDCHVGEVVGGFK